MKLHPFFYISALFNKIDSGSTNCVSEIKLDVIRKISMSAQFLDTITATCITTGAIFLELFSK